MDSEGISDSSDTTEMLDLISILQTRRIRELTPKTNPLDTYDDQDAYARFRFGKQEIYDILDLIIDQLKCATYKNTDIPPLLQLLIALRFYASGSFQLMNGDLHQSSQPSVSKVVKVVSRALSSLKQQFVKYPTMAEAESARSKFTAQIPGCTIPGVIGAIDCTHIPIKSVGGPDAEIYRNRKGRFTVNVQAVCNAELLFMNFVARWAGSVHDSRIFDNSLLRAKLGQNQVPGILLGDSGYACLPYLLTPLSNPVIAAERRYNSAQIRGRNCIERAFGVLKSRFPCLRLELRTKLSTTINVINACFILHNFAKERGLQDPEHEDYENDDPPTLPNTTQNASGNAFRQTIIQTFFN